MKYAKAKKISHVGQYAFTFDTLWRKLPAGLIEQSTAKNLAIIIHLMYEKKEYGHTEACSEFSA